MSYIPTKAIDIVGGACLNSFAVREFFDIEV